MISEGVLLVIRAVVINWLLWTDEVTKEVRLVAEELAVETLEGSGRSRGPSQSIAVPSGTVAPQGTDGEPT